MKLTDWSTKLAVIRTGRFKLRSATLGVARSVNGIHIWNEMEVRTQKLWNLEYLT